jgi:hypothetical protein
VTPRLRLRHGCAADREAQPEIDLSCSNIALSGIRRLPATIDDAAIEAA